MKMITIVLWVVQDKHVHQQIVERLVLGVVSHFVIWTNSFQEAQRVISKVFKFLRDEVLRSLLLPFQFDQTDEELIH